LDLDYGGFDHLVCRVYFLCIPLAYFIINGKLVGWGSIFIVEAAVNIAVLNTWRMGLK